MNYVGFIAGSTSLTLTISVNSCVGAGNGGSGIEAGIFHSDDCLDFLEVSTCDASIANNNSANIRTTKPLIIGECYYLVIDHNGSNIDCVYYIDVISGSTDAPIYPNSGVINGPSRTCIGDSRTFSIAPLPCQQGHTWTLDGAPVGSGSSVTVNFPTAGTYTICAQADGICQNIPPSCKTIVVPSDAPVIVPVQMCFGTCAVVGRDTFCSPGLYPINYTSSIGCDSLVHYIVSQSPQIDRHVITSICQGASYSFHGRTLTAAGNYQTTLPSANSCDTIVTLDLAVLPLASSNPKASICDGDVYDFNGQMLTTAGTYTAILRAANGCDSTVMLDLGVRPLASSAQQASICDGDVYDFNGQILTAAGTYTAILPDANGCDSTITLDLGVRPLASSAQQASICDGDVYDFNGQILTTAGTYTAKLRAANGCDSTAMLDLTVRTLAGSAQQASICDGDVYNFNGQTLTAAGTYTAKLTATNGCDSTITLDLGVRPLASSAQQASICNGDVYNFNGQTLTAAGTYTAKLRAANGCDSTVTLNLAVLPLASSAQQASICDGDVYNFNGQTLTAAGTYTAKLTAANGCDSTVTLNLVVLPLRSSTQQASICNGDVYNFNGQTLTAAGTYTAKLRAANGCDSTVTLVLAVLPLASSAEQTTICKGEMYFFHGQTLTTAGTYSATLRAANGCDSTVTLNLTTIICPIGAEVVGRSVSCYGFKNGSIWVEMDKGTPPIRFRLYSGANQSPIRQGRILDISLPFELDSLDAGSYRLSLKDEVGLEDSVEIQITEPSPFFLYLGDDLEVNYGETVNIRPRTNFSIEDATWQPEQLFECPKCVEAETKFLKEDVWISLVATDANGCVETDSIHVRVRNMPGVYAPNAFNPDSPFNPGFTLFGNFMVERISKLQVFDRWGSLIFEKNSFLPNDPDEGWDGSFKGKPLEPAVYVWLAEVVLINGARIQMEGDVTLVR